MADLIFIETVQAGRLREAGRLNYGKCGGGSIWQHTTIQRLKAINQLELTDDERCEHRDGLREWSVDGARATKKVGPPILVGSTAQPIVVYRKRQAPPGDRFQSVEESDADLIGVAPDQFNSQLQTVLRHQQVEFARYDRRAGKSQPCAITGHVADQAIDDAIASIKRNLSAQKRSSALPVTALDHVAHTQIRTVPPINALLSKGQAEHAAVALDIARAA